MRAATLTAGWLRGFNSKGVLDDTRYLSVSSGSTWVATPLILAVADEMKKGKTVEVVVVVVVMVLIIHGIDGGGGGGSRNGISGRSGSSTSGSSSKICRIQVYVTVF